MRRLLAVGLAAALGPGLAPGTAFGQAVRSRSADYLFVATAQDVRALWLNPAGLGVVTEASVMGEFVLERTTTDDLRLGQWTLGFNARGLSVGYQRDRFPGEEDSEALRFGVGLAFTDGALGATLTIYADSSTERGGDIGLQYHLAAPLDVGLVLRNIGRPTVRGSTLPLVGIIGLGWLPVPRVLALAGETHVTERLNDSGVDLLHRLGAHVATGSSLPVGFIAAFDLGGDLDLDAVTVGITVGGADRGLALGSALPRTDTGGFERFSLTGVASRRPLDLRP